MPTYEFRCPKGHEFERFYRTISAGVSELPCPECGAVATRQLSAGGGLVFKGSGFYLTDYGKNAHRGQKADKKSDEKADKTSETKADTKAETKTDTKSDTKTDTKAEPKAAPADAGTRKPKPKPTSE
jgi:putative FmdB family regulatory protein